MQLPLDVLDRDVSRAHRALSAARAELRDDRATQEPPSPLERHRGVSSRAIWLELGEVDGPLAGSLRAWVAALTLERVLWPDTVRLAAAWRRPSIPVGETGVPAAVHAPRDLMLRLLGEATPARARIWADALARGATPVHDAARMLAERRAEAGRLLDSRASAGASLLDALEVPAEPTSALAAAASAFLTATAGLAPRPASFYAPLSDAVGRDFAEGWPARLRARWLFELFRAGPLTEGLRPAIAPLPTALGASSFARALGAFGEALAEADGPSGPFSLARVPFDLRIQRRAALFASLAADPAFGVHALGLGRGRARDQARGVARALLIDARLAATRVLARGLLGLPEGERRSRFEELTGAALGVPLPFSLAGVVPRLGPDDAARFAGLLLAARDRRALVERFDEDWFRSPHAGRALREEDATPSPSPARANEGALASGVAEVVRALESQ
jgi:hypothetical protein